MGMPVAIGEILQICLKSMGIVCNGRLHEVNKQELRSTLQSGDRPWQWPPADHPSTAASWPSIGGRRLVIHPSATGHWPSVGSHLSIRRRLHWPSHPSAVASQPSVHWQPYVRGHQLAIHLGHLSVAVLSLDASRPSVGGHKPSVVSLYSCVVHRQWSIFWAFVSDSRRSCMRSF